MHVTLNGLRSGGHPMPQFYYLMILFLLGLLGLALLVRVTCIFRAKEIKVVRRETGGKSKE